MKPNQTAMIRRQIRNLPTGEILTPDSFPSISRNTTNKILTRLANEGVLARVKRGAYSRSKKTRFGQAISTPLQVLSQEIARDNNKCFGGLFLFNQLRLTTQIPSTIEILNNRSSYLSNIGNTRVRYVRIRPKITRSTKEAIQLLEVIKKIAAIPDGDIPKTLNWLNDKLKNSDPRKIKRIVSTAREYPPKVRAILGNLLENINSEFSEKLKNGLNKNSYYHVGAIAIHFKNHQNWNLKK